MIQIVIFMLLSSTVSLTAFAQTKANPALAEKYLKCLNTFPVVTSNKWLYGRTPYHATDTGSHYIFLRQGAYENQPAGFVSVQSTGITYCPFDKPMDNPHSIAVTYGDDKFNIEKLDTNKPGTGQSVFDNTKKNCINADKESVDHLITNQIGALLNKNIMHGEPKSKSDFKSAHADCRKLYVDYDKKINESYEDKASQPTTETPPAVVQ